jgi:tetratricopeptide (TPR) repeat protein
MFKNNDEIPITKDNGIIKKITQQGFSSGYPNPGDELYLHYFSELSDGRGVDNTHITKEMHITKLDGFSSLIPGLKLSLKTMKMGEKAIIKIQPEYSFLALEKLKELSKIEGQVQDPEQEFFRIINACKEEISDFLQGKSQEELKKLDVKEAKKYLPIIYDIEMVKFDKPRKSKQNMDPEEKVEAAGELKKEGNELFQQGRFREAMVKYEAGLDYISQIPTDFLIADDSKVYLMRMQFYLNLTNCHISLGEFNYGLKKVEKGFEIYERIPKTNPAKLHYYRCICKMNLGDFDEADSDLSILEKLLPGDQTIKKLKEDYTKLREKTLISKKGMLKKGLLSSNLYKDKEPDKEKIEDFLPEFNSRNFCFYLDFVIDGNFKNPIKLKFELFTNSSGNIRVNKEINEDILEKMKHKTLISEKHTIGIEIIKDQRFIYLFDVTKPYEFSKMDRAISEDFLLVLIDNKVYLSLDNISKSKAPLCILGRCFFNTKALENVRENGTKVTITDYDYTLNW